MVELTRANASVTALQPHTWLLESQTTEVLAVRPEGITRAVLELVGTKV